MLLVFCEIKWILQPNIQTRDNNYYCCWPTYTFEENPKVFFKVFFRVYTKVYYRYIPVLRSNSILLQDGLRERTPITIEPIIFRFSLNSKAPGSFERSFSAVQTLSIKSFSYCHNYLGVFPFRGTKRSFCEDWGLCEFCKEGRFFPNRAHWELWLCSPWCKVLFAPNNTMSSEKTKTGFLPSEWVDE